MANPWFRMYSEFSDDPKVQMMSEAMQRRLTMLMCLRCKDELHKLNDEHIAFALRITSEQLAETKICLVDAGFIDDKWCLIDWNRSQSPDRPPTHVWRVIRDRIFRRDDFTCTYCRQRGGKLECDHIIPVSKGGSHEDDNLTTSCFTCNRDKSDKFLHEWRVA